MKLIVVKCPKNKKVQVEQRNTLGAVCPDHCPLKQSSRCLNKTFRYSKPLPDSVVPDIPYVCASNADVTVSDAAPPPREAAPQPRTAYSAADTVSLAVEEQGANYEDPFANLPEEEYDFSFESRATQSSPTDASLLNKYNDVLDRTGLFSGIGDKREDEPCFIDGAQVFYERAPAGVRSAGNDRAAVRYIFYHWYVSRVFKEDGAAYTDEFLRLVKLAGYKSKEAEFKRIVDDVALSVNSKFFKIYYSIIYKNQINGFYWSDGDSPFRMIAPIFVNTADFYKKFSSCVDPTDFMTSFNGCLKELVYFLRSGAEGDGELKWLKDALPRYVAEKHKTIMHITEKNGTLTFVNLGSIRDFVRNMPKVQSEEKMLEKIEFLNDFEITENYEMIPRRAPLEDRGADALVEADGVYEVIGIYERESSRCATAFSYYAKLLREYMRVFKPESILIGECTFSMRNFYRDLLNVIGEAGAQMTSKDAALSDEVKMLYIVKAMFAFGVFDYYESRCETSKLRLLKEAFVERRVLDLKTYFLFKDIKHEVLVDKKTKSVSEYIFDLIGTDAYYTMGVMGDKIVEAYMDANIPCEKMAEIKKKVAELNKKHAALLDDF